jgi:hypothetical protein
LVAFDGTVTMCKSAESYSLRRAWKYLIFGTDGSLYNFWAEGRALENFHIWVQVNLLTNFFNR